jgi:hypothetical protein
VGLERHAPGGPGAGRRRPERGAGGPGCRPTDLATYQALYTRPVRRFYERLFGRPIDDVEWQHLDDVYHAGYAAALERARLATTRSTRSSRSRGTGRTQSLLSMYRHDELVPLVTKLGVHDHFVRIDGLRGPGGGTRRRTSRPTSNAWSTSPATTRRRC